MPKLIEGVNLFFQWKETDPSQLMDSKLKCVFMLPDQDLSNQENNPAANGGGPAMPMSNKSEYQSKQAIPPSPKVRQV